MNKLSISTAAAFICLIILAVNPASAEQQQTIPKYDKTAAVLIEDARQLLNRRTLNDYEQALTVFKAALADDPENPALMLAVADTLNRIMRVKTNGNVITIDGKTQDSEANKSVWKAFAPEAMSLSETVLHMTPKDPEALRIYAESYLYHSSSFGIIKAIYKGAADRYKENARKLIDHHPNADDALGHIYMGGFYLAAPWPLSSRSKAKKQFESALKLAPHSVRAHYYAGLLALLEKNTDTAQKELEFVLNHPCTAGSELDYCGFLKDQAALGLSQIPEP